MTRPINLVGRRFGRLVVIRRNGSTIQSKAIWRCECDCGNTCDVVGQLLRRGETQSCGCLHSEAAAKAVLTAQRYALKPVLLTCTACGEQFTGRNNSKYCRQCKPKAHTAKKDDGDPLITSDPASRITVELILTKIAAGETVDDLLADYPQLTREAVSAALRYAARAVRKTSRS